MSGAQASWYAPAGHVQSNPWPQQQYQQHPQRQAVSSWLQEQRAESTPEPYQQQQRYQQRYQQQPQQPYQQQVGGQAYAQPQPQPQPHPQQQLQAHQYQKPVAQQRSTPQAHSTPNSRPYKRVKPVQQQQCTQQTRQQQTQQAQRQRSQDTAAPWLNTLRDEVMQFSQQALPSPQEDQQRQAVLSSFEGVVNAVLGNSRRGVNVMLFGSARAGLALHNSDLDVMIVGLCAPNLPNGGYDKAGKQVAVRYLRQVLSESYRRMAVRTTKLIAHARIPVLKLEMRNGVELDVSINDSAGVNAANFLQSWQQEYVSMRPLVLVLKSILKENNLGDVATGGLGSWSLANMVIAHLMAEKKAGNQVDHPGAMLFSFLKRFGVDWNLNRDAVAVAQGGIVTRASLATNAGPFAGEDKLAVKDPLTGREVAGGSHRYADVQHLWQELYTLMRDQGPAAAGKAGGHYRILSIVCDCNSVLRRAGGPQQQQQQQQGGYRGQYGGNGGYSSGDSYSKRYYTGSSRKRER